MITPREDFRRDMDAKKAWLNVVDSQLFNRAALVALAEMQIQLSSVTGVDAECHNKMQGAKDFLNVLMDLAAPDVGESRPAVNKLNYGT